MLDRASIQQSLAQYPNSQRDFQAADKAIDMLDLAHNAGDSIGSYVFSDSVGTLRRAAVREAAHQHAQHDELPRDRRSQWRQGRGAPPQRDQRYFQDDLHESDNAILGLGGFLAGYAFEKSGDVDEALRYYDEALAFGDYPSLRAPLAALLRKGSYPSPRLRSFVGASGARMDERRQG